MVSLILEKLNQEPPRDLLAESEPVYRLNDPTFCYQEIVFPIAHKIMEAIESKLEVLNLEYEWYYPVDPSTWYENWEGIGPHFTLDFCIVKEDYDTGHEGWNFKGYSGWGNVGANIEIELALSPEIDVMSLRSKCFPELVNVVAHEIHHLTQYGAPLQKPDTTPYVEKTAQSHFEYFTSKTEVPAYVVGFRAESVFSGTPLESLAEEYLSKQESAGLITEHEKETILDRWINFSCWR